MNKELGRKITSLTLLSILLASGVTFAIPGVMPVAEAAHNANLFVSSENSQFSNYFAGPQVIEVVINDNDIKTLDDAHGEPDVTVNGKKLRMAQATDGNWYAYFADRTQAQLADDIASNMGIKGNGTDFGQFCDETTTFAGLSLFIATTGFSVARTTAGATEGQAAFTACTAASASTNPPLNHVVRENKTLNRAAPGGAIGQIGVDENAWPVIQTYDFSVGGNVEIKYNKGGGTQTTTLTFDTIPSNLITHTGDRTTYPRNAQVHVTLTDPQLNIDPTDEDSWTWNTNATNSTLYYQLFDENGAADADNQALVANVIGNLTGLMFEKNGRVTVALAAQGGANVAAFGDNNDQVFPASSIPTANNQQMTFLELERRSGIFGNYDEADNANLDITATAERGKSATIRYNDVSKSIVVGFSFASVAIDAPDGEWGSGEEIPVTLVDADANTNSRADEDLDLNVPANSIIPTMKIGTPFTLATGDQAAFLDGTFTLAYTTTGNATLTAAGSSTPATATVDTFSQRALITPSAAGTYSALVVDLGTRKASDLFKSINNPAGTFSGLNLFNYDVRGLNSTITSVSIFLLHNTTDTVGDIINSTGQVQSGLVAISIANATSPQDIINFNSTTTQVTIVAVTNVTDNIFAIDSNDRIGLLFNFTAKAMDASVKPIVADFFSVGTIVDGINSADRINNAIYRFELEETGDNTSTFIGSAEFTMLNQLNIFDNPLYEGLRTIDDEVTLIVHDDSDDEDSPRVNYADLGQDGSVTPVADQQAAPTHSGVVSFDKDTYKLGDTVTVTLEDGDLNVDSDLIDIYVTVTPSTDPAADAVGEANLPLFADGSPLGRLMDITFDDLRWVNGTANSATTVALQCADTDEQPSPDHDDGLSEAGFSLIETGTNTGVFNGDFLLPNDFCDTAVGERKSVTGVDIEVNYVDFRDASGQIIEVGDGAGVRANTGSVSLDRTIYPVPFGKVADSTLTGNTPNGRSLFPIHQTGLDTTNTLEADETIGEGDLTVIIRVTDPDFDVSFAGEDQIASNATTGVGPVKITTSRGSSEVTLGYAGGPAVLPGLIDVDDNSPTTTRQLGPMLEIAPDAGIFETELILLFTDGPASGSCAGTTANTVYTNLATPGGAAGAFGVRFDAAPSTGNFCILQGDIITIEYTDPTDASGDLNTVTDSATFDLRNGVLQSDKSVYIIGADMIMTLIEPDLDLDSDTAESYDLDLVEWDSDAATITMGDQGGFASSFDPEPSDFRETGDNTGIFQVVIEIPSTLDNELLDRGEEIQLEYSDWGPSGADFVGDEDEDVNLTIYTSNFGATVELDQKVYSWTDKVFITIVAPDHNFDSNLIDEIGEADVDKVQVSTRGDKLSNYKLVETGTDTGIFTGEVILTGFPHDADGDTTTGTATTGSDTNPRTEGSGPTSGFLRSDDDDGITVSFEFTEDETVVGSALVRWNIGELQYLEASYPATGQGVLRVVDPDLNLNPEAVDNFDVDVWSDSDAGGIDLTVTETNEATGIFEGTVYFTITDESSGHRLRVAEGDTVTGEYEDNTLPSPYTTADELEVTATTFIGTVVPPLERAPATNPRIVDAFGNELDELSVDQQVQITADLANGQDRDQSFAYLVQISKDGVTHSLSWITGSLAPGQSLNPAQSWTPSEAGTYDVQIFVWESVDNPDALSPPVETTVDVV